MSNSKQRPKEAELYPPVKALLEAQGYEVKAEVASADVVGKRGDEPPVVVEMKTGFSLALFHQAVERLNVVDHVYVAVPRATGATFWKALKANTKLCRRLGLGLITVRLKDGFAEVHCDPAPYAPRKNKRKSEALLREFQKRQGDPNVGGVTRTTIVTAYRQDAQKIADYLKENGPTKASIVAKETGVDRARAIMADNHYGWFEKVERGVYTLAVSPSTPQSDQKTA
ncbi:MAG: DUF2161 family putative PD-(D/E)XK-type phosphodiesterase [Pseudomonadota bacterium]